MSMITDARAQIDLIAALHLEVLFEGLAKSARGESNRMTRTETAMPHSKRHDSIQLRDRLALIRSLALRAQGLTSKTDIANGAAQQMREAVSSLPAVAVAAQEATLCPQCMFSMLKAERGTKNS
jgi:hypothetical protein